GIVAEYAAGALGLEQVFDHVEHEERTHAVEAEALPHFSREKIGEAARMSQNVGRSRRGRSSVRCWMRHVDVARSYMLRVDTNLGNRLLAREEDLLEPLARPDAAEHNIDIAARFETGQLDHALGELDDFHRLAHVEHVDGHV